MLVVSARVTWAGVRLGNWARMSATMPATIALAALVLLTWVYALAGSVAETLDGLAAVTPAPAAVTVTYGRSLVNGALMKCWSNAPTAMTPW